MSPRPAAGCVRLAEADSSQAANILCMRTCPIRLHQCRWHSDSSSGRLRLCISNRCPGCQWAATSVRPIWLQGLSRYALLKNTAVLH